MKLSSRFDEKPSDHCGGGKRKRQGRGRRFRGVRAFDFRRQWRATWGENANWKITVKTTPYRNARRAGAGHSIYWLLQNTRKPLLVSEIADQLVTNGDAVHLWDANKERDRIQVALRHLRKKKLAASIAGPGDRRLRWIATDREEAEQAEPHVSLESTRQSELSDLDWAVIRNSLPPHSRRADAEATSRRFIDAVFNDLAFDGSTGLTLGQIKRFWSWREFGVWRAIIERLGHKFSEEALDKLSKKLALISDDGAD
ncbi:MAG: hypothetical protein KF910_01445 [Brevundimonas sp.]|uniref:hypothetical protein n=1 Tax=Brevundimonas sp. TaxID=1871086 RepID=UPI0025BE0FD7|nr:hypothetical protein [Brevundimonas sp.]MBX3476247.1 hypothetical protein [Brevundimonas sp.]